jgi:peptide/nickel transport system permease protein
MVALGPYLAPHDPNAVVALPYGKPGGAALLGADYLGRDVWSRLLAGGRPVLISAVLATALGMLLGVTIGMVAAYTRGWLGEVIMRMVDVVLAFPSIVLALLVLSVWGTSAWLIIVLTGISHAPRVARLAQGMTRTIATREYVQSAEALGDSRRHILFAEILPNMSGPLLAETGLRLTYSIALVASVGFLGFVADPRAANWGLAINENRLALLVQPWAILAPVLAIALLSVGTNLVSDGIAKAAAGSDQLAGGAA